MKYDNLTTTDSVDAVLEYKAQCREDGSITPKEEINQDIDLLLDRRLQIMSFLVLQAELSDL